MVQFLFIKPRICVENFFSKHGIKGSPENASGGILVNLVNQKHYFFVVCT